MDPPVSVPTVAEVKCAATAEAHPPDDPPGTKSLSFLYGLMTFPK